MELKLRPALERCQLFSGLGKEQMEAILPLCKQVSIEVGGVLFQEGEDSTALYVLEEGKIALEMPVKGRNGRPPQPRVVATLGPGEALGWSAIVEPHLISFTARAVQPCTLVCIDGAALRKLMKSHRELGYEVMAGVAKLLAHRLDQNRQALAYWLLSAVGAE